MNLQIKELTKQLFVSFGSNKVITKEMIVDRADAFQEISALCKKVSGLDSDSAQSEEFSSHVSNLSGTSDPVIESWDLLINDLSKTSDESLIDEATIFHIPVIAHFLALEA